MNPMGRIAASNQLTMEQYIEQIHSSGSTLSAVREEIRNEMILMRVQQGYVMRRINISSQELDNFPQLRGGSLYDLSGRQCWPYPAACSQRHQHR